MIAHKFVQGELVILDSAYWAALEYAADQFLAREAASRKSRRDNAIRSARAKGALPLWMPKSALRRGGKVMGRAPITFLA